jgi:hypothetical protein
LAAELFGEPCRLRNGDPVIAAPVIVPELVTGEKQDEFEGGKIHRLTQIDGDATMTVRPGKGSLHRQVVDRPRPLGPDLTGWKLPAGPVAPTQSPVEDTRLLMVGGNGYCQRAIGLDPLFNDECKAAPGLDLFNGGGH